MPNSRHLEGALSARRHGHKAVRSLAGEFRTIVRISRSLAIDLVVLGAGVGLAARMSAQAVEESQVKAAYLYNFAKFVEWPAGVFRSPDDPAVICVVGDERTGAVLEPAVSGKKANGRPVEIRRPNSSEGFKSCHVLFIGFSDKKNISQLLNQLRQSSVLTVGQSEQFIPLGGMINLALRHATIELEIAPDASNAVGLKISSRLLVVAHLVKAGDQGGGER